MATIHACPSLSYVTTVMNVQIALMSHSAVVIVSLLPLSVHNSELFGYVVFKFELIVEDTGISAGQRQHRLLQLPTSSNEIANSRVRRLSASDWC